MGQFTRLIGCLPELSVPARMRNLTVFMMLELYDEHSVLELYSETLTESMSSSVSTG
jgi:hypothetical protein